MARFSSYIEGPRWANAGEAIEVFAMRNGIDVRTVTTKYLLRERIDFTINGTTEEIQLIKTWLAAAVKEYNK